MKFAIVSLAVLLGFSASAFAQEPAPKAEISLGYSYLHTNAPPADCGCFNMNGGSGSFAWDITRRFGLAMDLGYEHQGNVNSTQQDLNLFTYVFGPRYFFRTYSRLTPFGHVLVGGVRATSNFAYNNANEFAMITGGGLDITLSKHWAWRALQADYVFTLVHNGVNDRQNNFRAITGLVYRFGEQGSKLTAPLTYSCSVNPASVYAGEPVSVSGTSGNFPANAKLVYSWTGGPGVNVNSNSATANIDTGNLKPGSYSVTGHVADQAKPGRSAECNATFEVKQIEPPTVSCAVNPSTVAPGDTATVAATGVSPQNRVLKYTFSSSSGTVTGSGNTATLNTAGISPGSITVTCTATDDLGQSASSEATLTVSQPSAPAPPPTPQAQRLCSVSFKRDKLRLARVDNEAKACLDDIALNLQHQPDATLSVIGGHASDEKDGQDLAAERALNVRDYLTREKGIDSTRINVLTGNSNEKDVTNYLLPAGAKLEDQSAVPVNESQIKRGGTYGTTKHKTRRSH